MRYVGLKAKFCFCNLKLKCYFCSQIWKAGAFRLARGRHSLRRTREWRVARVTDPRQRRAIKLDLDAKYNKNLQAIEKMNELKKELQIDEVIY
jgi:hypothetical protein